MKTNTFKAIIFTCIVLCVLALNGCNGFVLTQTQEATSQVNLTQTQGTASTPLPPITSDSLQLTFEDDFSNSGRGWSVSSGEGARYSYINQEYNISISDSGMWHSSVNNVIGEQDNFVVEVDTRVLSSTDKSKYGVSFRRNDKDGFYLFAIAGNHYTIQKYVQNQWFYLQRSTESKYIMTDGSTNTLKIACLGTTIEVYVNGQSLATVDDDSIKSGKLGLTVSETNTSVIFDNFKLYKFSNSYIKKAVPAMLVIDTSSLQDGEVNVKYNETLAFSGGASPYSWAIFKGTLPEGLSLVGSTGAITGIPTMEGTYDFIVKLTGSTGEAIQELSIYISELYIATDSLASGLKNVKYNQALKASGGKLPFTWSIESGKLPDGLTLDAATGTITGTATQSGGTVTPVFKVVDSAGASATRGLSLTIKPGDFQAIDQYAVDTPKSAETSLQTLVSYLVKPYSTDTEKARVIYRWIAGNIDYDVPTYDSGLYKTANCPNQSAEAVFTRRNAVCEGYANLFLKMAGYAGLQAVKISGWGRVDYTNAGYTKDHAWNAVKIDGQWQLLDATWGAGYADDSRHYVRKFDDFWFLTPSHQYIYTHYPDDASWQLLNPTVPVAEVAQYPVLYPDYFIYGLNFGTYNHGLYNVNNGAGTICIQAPDDVLVMAELFQNKTKLSSSLVLCQREGNTYQINGRYPNAGDYELRIYAKWNTESDTYHSAITYKLTSNQNILSQAAFPTVYGLFYSKKAYLYSPMTANLQAGTSQYFKISVPGAKKVSVILNADSASRIFQPLSKQGQLFQGTFNIVEGKILIVAYFTSDDTYNWIVEYKGVVK